ncbi:MAG: biotin--[acetyl-CoA-carboxylase] ligase [Candidatus Binatia bacterium]
MMPVEPLRPHVIQQGMETRRVGKTIHHFPELDSTNVYAFQRAQEGAAEGEIVIAEGQTRGKGRMGRAWVSPPYRNLYLSVILRPALAPPRAAQVTLMAAVALAETVRAFLPFPPEIKWPNDILVGGKKLAGILTESSMEADRVRFVIVGIGVNLNFPKELMPEDIRDTATSVIILTRKAVDREEFARRLIQDLDRCYGDLEERGFASLAQRWERWFVLKGKMVRVEMMGQPIVGKAMGIDSDGALLLEDEQGASRRVIAGDVIPLEE